MPRPDSLVIRVLLTTLVAFGPLSTDLYLPSLPTLVAILDSDIATVQLTLSVFLAGFAVSQLVYGPVSDRFGRRPALLGGIAIFLVASAACAFAGNVEELIVARFFQAVGACCGPVVARAIVRDVFGRERAATVLAYMAMAMALAPAIGPVLGGWLTDALGWRSNFVLLTLFACTILVAVWSLLDETNVHRDPEALKPGRLIANYVLLFRSGPYIGCVLTAAFSYSGIFSFISGSSFVLINRLHLTPPQYGMSFGAVVMGYMAGSFLAGQLTRRFGSARMMRYGTAVSLAGGLAGMALAIADVVHLAAILIPVFIVILGCGLTLSNAMANAVGPYPMMAGLASALLGFMQMAVAAAIGAAIGHMNDGTQLPMMEAIGVVTIGAAIACRLLVPVPHKTGSSL